MAFDFTCNNGKADGAGGQLALLNSGKIIIGRTAIVLINDG
jgi:hypothetical protein